MTNALLVTSNEKKTATTAIAAAPSSAAILVKEQLHADQGDAASSTVSSFDDENGTQELLLAAKLFIDSTPFQLQRQQKEVNKKISTSSSCKTCRKQISLTNMTRCLLLDLPLALIFALWVSLCLVRNVHNEFYVPLFDRSTRTNAQLQEEFTYYERQCTEYDISTDNIQNLLLERRPVMNLNVSMEHEHPNTGSDPRMVPTAMRHMLRHGATVIPNVLTSDVVTALRDYVVRRNAAVTADERYPMSQGERRLSYGVDAAEDGAVATAIAHVANHPVVRPLLAALLGDDDPASAEITVITAYYGAEDQAWHQDTKQDGNAIKVSEINIFFSLFVLLHSANC